MIPTRRLVTLLVVPLALAIAGYFVRSVWVAVGALDVVLLVLALVDGEIKLDGTPREVLTDAKLENWGIGTTQYTRAARIATEQNLVNPAKLPITLKEAEEVFKRP